LEKNMLATLYEHKPMLELTPVISPAIQAENVTTPPILFEQPEASINRRGRHAYALGVTTLTTTIVVALATMSETKPPAPTGQVGQTQSVTAVEIFNERPRLPKPRTPATTPEPVPVRTHREHVTPLTPTT
jgi:hypothetical protein